MVRWLFLLIAGGLVAAFVSFETVPTTNTHSTTFDTIIVLGSPTDPDGTPSSEQRERVMAGVREYRVGRAQHLILSGGPTFGGSTEGEVMARLAAAAGLPMEDIIVEPHAINTIENVYYSYRIMQAHGWTSAEVVSSPSHLPRASLILQHYPMAWKTFAAKWPAEYDRPRIERRYLHEVLGTTALRWFGFAQSPYLP